MPDVQASVTAPAQRTVAVAPDSTGPEAPKPLPWPVKDPDEILDYALDWSARLTDGDTIEWSDWINYGKLQILDTWWHPTLTQLWIKGGEPEKTYFATNRIRTVNGRHMDQTCTITIVKSR